MDPDGNELKSWIPEKIIPIPQGIG
jgi:hypothetical protein